jgi:glycosyltransferase involved in cell wall biosynthesis
MASLRVLLDGRPLQGPTGSRGAGHYVRDLVRGLLALEARPGIGLLFDPREEPSRHPFDADPVLWVPAIAPPGPALLWGRVLGPGWIRAAEAEIWHATFLAPPRVPPGMPWVATIYDLIPLLYPRCFNVRQRLVFSRSLALAARAPVVVAISRCTADLVLSHLGAPASRVEVIPAPVDVERFASPRERGVSGLDAPYLLHLGGFDPLKGVEDLLLPAFAAVARRRRELTLALTGAPGPDRERVARMASDLGVGSRVRFLGFLADDQHVAAVAGAAAVVVSSREEGFGLPAVEALAAGIPLALGPARAAREVAGPCAALAPDDTPAGLALAVEDALELGGPDSVEGGARRRHVAQYDFRVVAGAMFDLYGRLLERGR